MNSTGGRRGKEGREAEKHVIRVGHDARDDKLPFSYIPEHLNS
jgi:hypothetical protein